MTRCCKVAALTIAMSLAAVAAPVLAQSRSPVPLKGVFDPDLPDITKPRGRTNWITRSVMLQPRPSRRPTHRRLPRPVAILRPGAPRSWL
jgi:hypothetical protein